MNEVWKQIPGYEGYYEASTSGRIRSIDRMVPRKKGKMRVPGRLMTPSKGNQYGHLYVSISKDGKHRFIAVHYLVAITFLGPVPTGKEICHGKEGRLVNDVKNIRYGTRRENIHEMIEDGNHYRKGSPSLTHEQIRNIRSSVGSCSVVAEIYGVDPSHIVRIRNRKSYAWVK